MVMILSPPLIRIEGKKPIDKKKKKKSLSNASEALFSFPSYTHAYILTHPHMHVWQLIEIQGKF